MNIDIPKLLPGSRSREYNSYPVILRDKIVYEYLFNAKSHRDLDEMVLNLEPKESHGYQTMGILHFIGLKEIHKGIFNGLAIHKAIKLLKSEGDEFQMVISSLERIQEYRTLEKVDKEHFEDIEKEFEEGRIIYKFHRIRERNTELISQAKKEFKEKHGELFCEVCKINFGKVYGERGKDFIEGHHTKPISKMKQGEVTRIEDIAMLCSNCHSMIHREPFISVGQLRELYQFKNCNV